MRWRTDWRSLLGGRAQLRRGPGRWKHVATSPGFVGRRVLLIGLTTGIALGAAAVFAVLGFRWWWYSLGAAAIVLFAHLATSRGGVLDPWSWIRGLDGQARVSAELRGLARLGYHVFEPVEVPYGDVDHVVVGRTGVFAIETKNWPGRIEHSANGLRRDGWDASDGVRQAVRNAIAIREMTGVRWVDAVLVCVDGVVDGDPIELGNVTVTTPAGVQSVVTSTRHALSKETIEAIVERLAAGDQAPRDGRPWSLQRDDRTISQRPGTASVGDSGEP